MEVLKYLVPPMDVFLMRPHTSENKIFKGLVIRFSIPHSETQLYTICFRYKFRKATMMWDKKVYQGSFYSPCFKVNECPLRSNGRSGGAKSQAHYVTLEIESSWPYPLRVPSQSLFRKCCLHVDL